MTSSSAPSPVSKRQLWTGRSLTVIAVLFMSLDGAFKMVRPLPQPVADSFVQLGYAPSLAPVLGLLSLACTLLYVLPRTSFLGAVLFTGYLGGAVATHVRHGDPLFSHILFPVYIAALVWGGLFLRDTRVRALFGFRRPVNTCAIAPASQASNA